MPDRRSSISPAAPSSLTSSGAAARRAIAAWASTLLVIGGLALILTAVLRAAFDTPPLPPQQVADARDHFPETGTEVTAPVALDLPAFAGFAPGAIEETATMATGEGPEPSPPDAPYEMAVRLEKGDTLAGLLRDLGFEAREVAKAIAALSAHANLRRLAIGQEAQLRIKPGASPDDKPVLLALSLRPEARREVTLQRDDDGDFDAAVKTFKVETRPVRAQGEVDGSLIVSARAAGMPQEALAEMLRAFAYDVDFQRDIKAGDRFDALFEQSRTEDGRELDLARLLWAEITVRGGRKLLAIYRFAAKGRDDLFFTRDGASVVKALLRTPLNLSRVSSRFGMRRHPLLGFTRMHTGVDFVAPPGTPVLAAGDGQVVEAGPNGGYGRWVKISHGGGLASGYAHLSRIAAGVKRSARVRQGQVIGFVGSTGLSTGPHLHFELHRAGRPVNPMGIAHSAARDRLTGSELERFRKRVAEIDRAREDAAAPR